MSALEKNRLTPEQYLEHERKAGTKSEYYAGQMFAMAGVPEAHVLLVANLVIAFGIQFRGRSCKTYSTDMKVRIGECGTYTYPDVALICGPPEFADDKRDVLLNPRVIVEVLSPSTGAYDRGEKLLHYRRLPSLTDYLLVFQNVMRIEHYARQTDGAWRLTDALGPDAEIVLESVRCRLLLSDVYDKLEISPSAFQLVLRE